MTRATEFGPPGHQRAGGQVRHVARSSAMARCDHLADLGVDARRAVDHPGHGGPRDPGRLGDLVHRRVLPSAGGPGRHGVCYSTGPIAPESAFAGPCRRAAAAGSRRRGSSCHGRPLVPHLTIGRMQSLTRRSISSTGQALKKSPCIVYPRPGGQPEAGRVAVDRVPHAPGAASAPSTGWVAGQALLTGYAMWLLWSAESRSTAVPALREVEVRLQHRAGRAGHEVLATSPRARRAGRTSARWCCRPGRWPGRCRPRSAGRTAAAGSARSGRRGRPHPGSRRCRWSARPARCRCRRSGIQYDDLSIDGLQLLFALSRSLTVE